MINDKTTHIDNNGKMIRDIKVRKPIQLIQNEKGPMVSLCDDGTMWYAEALDNDTIKWVQLPSIPQGDK